MTVSSTLRRRNFTGTVPPASKTPLLSPGLPYAGRRYAVWSIGCGKGLTLGTSRYPAQPRYDGRVLLHAFRVRLHPVACAKAREARPGGERLPQQPTLHLLEFSLEAGVSSLARPPPHILIYGGVGVALRLLLVSFPTGRLSRFAAPVPRVAAPRLVAGKLGPVRVVLPNDAQAGKHAAKGFHHPYLVQAPRHVRVYAALASSPAAPPTVQRIPGRAWCSRGGGR